MSWWGKKGHGSSGSGKWQPRGMPGDLNDSQPWTNLNNKKSWSHEEKDWEMPDKHEDRNKKGYYSGKEDAEYHRVWDRAGDTSESTYVQRDKYGNAAPYVKPSEQWDRPWSKWDEENTEDQKKGASSEYWEAMEGAEGAWSNSQEALLEEDDRKPYVKPDDEEEHDGHSNDTTLSRGTASRTAKKDDLLRKL